MDEKYEAEDADPNVGFLYKTMLHRDPRKRRVKPVERHLLQVNFGGDDSDDDSDFDVGKHHQGGNDDDDDDEREESDEEEVVEGSDSDAEEEEGADSDRSEVQSASESESSSGENDDDDEDEDDDDDDIDEDDDDDDDEEEEKKSSKRNLFDLIDSDDEDDEDYVPKKNKKQKALDKQSLPVEKQRIKSPDIKKGTAPVHEIQSSRPMKVLICCVCLGDISEDDDEIVECDNCGVAVHEGCYGISDNQSAASTESSASTEPWFCDACKAGVKPDCELCPNEGGIFKETDAGKWVHLVCALYTPGVAFGDVDKLSPVTLFEMPYSRWGLKECSLCEDSRFCRTGVCISCDAGMCRSYFHVTCAQREGLLSEASPEEVMDIADPFFAYCKLHADKNSARAKRRNWLAIQSHVRQHAQTDIQDEKERMRFQRKLNRHRQKYLVAKAKRPPAWVPTQKMSRYLTSSPSVVKKMLRKAELMGIITQSQHVAHTSEKQENRKKTHISPSFSAEFVTHYLERNVRIENWKSTLKELMSQNERLRGQERILRTQYEQLLNDSEKSKDSITQHRKDGDKLWTILSALGGKLLKLPEVFIQKKVVRSPARRELPRSPPAIINQCGICCKTDDQHLLARCDKCRLWYHLGCLDPPLSRMPKKTSRQGWHCSECAGSSSEESEGSSVNVNAPRRLREKIKEPAKFTTSQELEFLFPHHLAMSSRKGRKKKGKRKKCGTKAETIETREEELGESLTLAAAEDDGEEEEEEEVEREREEMDKDVELKEVCIKVEPIQIEAKEDFSRTGRRRIKKKRYDSDSDVTPPKQVKKAAELRKTPLKKSHMKEEQSTDHLEAEPLKQESFGTHCATCGEPGDKSNMVSCDECQLCYHFKSCLDPPFKKMPKQRGYTWYCEACDTTPSDQSEGAEVKTDNSKAG